MYSGVSWGRPEWAEGLRQQDLPGAGGDLEMGKRPEMGESPEVEGRGRQQRADGFSDFGKADGTIQ